MTKFWSTPQLEQDGYERDMETVCEGGLWYWIWSGESWNQWGPYQSEADAINAVMEAVIEAELSEQEMEGRLA